MIRAYQVTMTLQARKMTHNFTSSKTIKGESSAIMDYLWKNANFALKAELRSAEQSVKNSKRTREIVSYLLANVKL